MLEVHCKINTIDNNKKPRVREFRVTQREHEHNMFGQINSGNRIPIPIGCGDLEPMIEYTLKRVQPNESLNGIDSINLVPSLK